MFRRQHLSVSIISEERPRVKKGRTDKRALDVGLFSRAISQLKRDFVFLVYRSGFFWSRHKKTACPGGFWFRSDRRRIDEDDETKVGSEVLMTTSHQSSIAIDFATGMITSDGTKRWLLSLEKNVEADWWSVGLSVCPSYTHGIEPALVFGHCSRVVL